MKACLPARRHLLVPLRAPASANVEINASGVAYRNGVVYTTDPRRQVAREKAGNYTEPSTSTFTPSRVKYLD